MAFRLSADGHGAGFGFLTSCVEFDKWSHFAGSVAGTVFFWTIIFWRSLDSYSALIQATAIVFVLGFGLEVWQGIKEGNYAAGVQEDIDEYIETIKTLDAVADSKRITTFNIEIKNLRHLINGLDGFSWRDLLADCIGISLVWLLYHVLTVTGHLTKAVG